MGDGTMSVFLNYSSNITIVGCEASNTSIGIYFKNSSNSTVAGCTISGNGNGIVLDSSFSNIVANNTVVENNLGILLYSSSSNTVFNNRFANKFNWNVAGNSTGNAWNISRIKGRNIAGGPCLGGNFWSDYKGVDEDKDGVGDTQVPHGPGDYLPLVKYGNAPPQTDFFHYPLIITCMTEASFLDNSTDPDGKVVSWLWDFGDGCNATGRMVTHVYTRKGNYTVRLSIMDDEGLEASCSKTVTVYNSPPVANFTHLPREPRVNETIVFTSNSTDPDGRTVSWEWLFGDGEKDTGENVTHAYRKEGNYTVVLIVEDDEGETDSYLLTVSVKSVSKPTGETDMQHSIWILVVPAAIAIVTAIYVAFRKCFLRSRER
jgi:parallel beta-helix repeat protein